MHLVLEIHIFSRKWVKNLGDGMIRYTGTEQLSFEGFETHLGKELDGTNRMGTNGVGDTVRCLGGYLWTVASGGFWSAIGRCTDCDRGAIDQTQEGIK